MDDENKLQINQVYTVDELFNYLIYNSSTIIETKPEVNLFNPQYKNFTKFKVLSSKTKNTYKLGKDGKISIQKFDIYEIECE
jgi:hypothetical protein